MLNLKNKVKKIVKYVKNNKTESAKIFFCSSFIVWFLTVGVFFIAESKKSEAVEVSKYGLMVVDSTTTEPDTETTTAEVKKKTEKKEKTVFLENCHFNSDGKLYGIKGTYSGLWPDLEEIVNASSGSWTALKEWVGDSSGIEKSNYEEDKFVKINGYGTVHWCQSGQPWSSPYSIADKSGYTSSTLIFSAIENDDVSVDMDEAVEEQNKINSEIIASEEDTNSGEATDASTDSGDGTNSESEDVASDSAVDLNNDSSNTVAAPRNNSSSTTGKWVYSGNVWGSDSCGTCILGMVLSTLSGVTVSPPEVALAANALIGEKAWYGTVLYSQAQAKLAQMAGFTVKTEEYSKATKAAMDDCLDNNGMAIFVTDKQTWASGGGKHYIAVRNKVGDKYYTCDSGKNPTRGFTYDEISAGYNQQLIVYVYPKGYKEDKK